MNLDFQSESWSEYQWWQLQDRRTLKRINRLLDDIARNGNQGIGNPEALTGDLAGWWSRRIDEKNRLVYRVLADGTIQVNQCRGHYDDN
ncbi:MAG: Txe/YoeB family addiction module toxin [Propionibacteriaceae bacterium]|jgi:toxin YoeB|nr:Txe/YoeB family addiction module toxin [Propionibacteriaceae bacterium]